MEHFRKLLAVSQTDKVCAKKNGVLDIFKKTA